MSSLLLKQREIKKAEIKFHSVSANSSVFEETKMIFLRIYSTILKYLLLFWIEPVALSLGWDKSASKPLAHWTNAWSVNENKF